MKKVASFVALCAALLVIIPSANAADKNKIGYEFSADGKTVRVVNPPKTSSPEPRPPTTLKTIASNFSTYSLATYFSIWGNTIAQGGSNFPFQTWVAEAFTPTADATVTKIQVSAGRQSGTTHGFEVSLYNDAGGIPGTAIKSVHVTTLPTYGQCCHVATANITGGVPVTAGTQYWVVVSTTAQDTDIYAWAFNSTDMTAHLGASWCLGSSTYCGSNSGIWVPISYVQLGFAVFGQ